MAIIRKEAYFSSSNLVDNVRVLIWQDDEKQPVGVVQIAHGLAEHIGRYDDFARFLASHGYVVCGNDHLGHGKTAAIDSLGYVYEGDHANMLRDMNTLHNIMSKRYPEIPYIIFGHSMGSFLARIYTGAFPERLSGAIYCGTGQLPLPVLMLEDPIKFLMDKLPENSSAPASVASIFERLTMHSYKETDCMAWLSRSEKNRESFKEDELCGAPMSPSLAKEVIILAVKASNPDLPRKLPKDLPVLLISGAKDPIGAFGRGVLSVADSLTKAGIEPEVILYPADRHEILNEDDNEKVYSDVLEFLTGITNDNCAE